MRLLAPLLCLASAMALAQDESGTEPGPVPIRAAKVRELVVPPRKGDAHAALKVFLAAHRAHLRGDTDAALKGYLEFLGYPARTQLPPRYETTSQDRLAALRKVIASRFAKATALYAKNRKKGVAALKALAASYPVLPEGAAARRLWHSDALLAVLEVARANKDKKAAARSLEKAIRAFGDAIYRYEAKATLIELGGPDLFEPGERVAESDGDRDGDASDKDDDNDDDEGCTTIEDGDG